MTNGGAKPGWPEGLVSCRTAGELFTVDQCEQVVEFLRRAQAVNEQTGDSVRAHVLAVARHICLAYRQSRSEVEWHRRAYEEADQRRHELKQLFQAILDLIGGRESPETREMPSAVSTPDPGQPERAPPESADRPSLWQRFQSLLERKPPPRSPERESPVASTEALTVPPVKKDEPKKQAHPSLAVYCLGSFRVYQDDQPVADWPSSKGKAIFKYLVTHRERPVVKEVLMELFWPNAHPDAARNNLNVAIYGLRQALRQTRPSFSHVLFQDDSYLLNPDLSIWVDHEAFMEHLTATQALERRGDRVAAMREYRAAEALYQGEFMEEDRYEDWLMPQRQGLQDDYLSLLDRLSRYYFDRADYAACATVCGKTLAVDPCREETHRRLMRCYSRQGQPYLALRQYHLCVEALEEELDVSPTQTTTALYDQIRQGKRI